MRVIRVVAAGLVLSLVVVACGDDGSETTIPSDGGGSGQDVQADDAPVIDPAAMPESGHLEFEVANQVYDFDISTYDCQIGPDIVFVGLTDEGGVFISATSTDGSFAGQVQINAPDTGRVYGSLAGLEGQFAVEGSTAVYQGRFGWATRDNPGVSEDAGTGTIRIAC